MTVTTSANKVIWQGNGATAVFTYSFPIPVATWVVLTYTDATGNQTVLGSSQYTITGIGSPNGGTLTYPISGAPIAAGTTLTLQRVAPYTQETSLTNQGGLWPTAIEQGGLDELEYQIQQLAEQTARALLFNPSDAGPFPPLPVASRRANLALMFDNQGNPIASGLAPGSVVVSSVMIPVVGASTTQEALALLHSFLPFTTIAALRLNTIIAPTIAYVQGYYGNSDGGEGSFVYVSTDITSTDNGGTIIVDAIGQRWYREVGSAYSAKWFGAKGDGVTNDTTAITNLLTAAAAADAKVYFPGTSAYYLVNSAFSLASPIEIYGDYQVSQIGTSSATLDIFDITGAGIYIHDLIMNNTGTPTAGSMINITAGSNIKIERVKFSHHFTGITINGSTISTVDITNCYFLAPVATKGIDIFLTGAALDIAIRHCNFSAGGVSPFPLAGIRFNGVADAVVEDCNIQQHAAGMLIDPQTNTDIVSSVYCSESFFDHCTNGLQIEPVNGTVVRCHFIGCWGSSSTAAGMLITSGGSGSVNGIEFVDCQAFGNGTDGFSINFGTNLNFTGCVAAGNPAGGGIALNNSSVGGVCISGCSSGVYGGFGANNYGIFVITGVNNYLVVGNRCESNTTANLSDSGGPNKVVANNLTT